MHLPAMTDQEKKQALESFCIVLDRGELLRSLAEYLRMKIYEEAKKNDRL